MEAGQHGLSGPTVHLNVTPVIKFESDFVIHLLLCMVVANARAHTSRPETVTPTPAQVPAATPTTSLHSSEQTCMNVLCLPPQVHVHRAWCS